MKKIVRSFASAAFMLLIVTAFAQCGGGGASPAAASYSVSTGNSGRPSDAGSGASGRLSVASLAPDKVLDNSLLRHSLTDTLLKSGMSIPGGDIKSACSAYKNLGQCVAALHAATNVEIVGGFVALTEKVTGSRAQSLGQAIRDLSPNSNFKAESKRANKQADTEISELDRIVAAGRS